MSQSRRYRIHMTLVLAQAAHVSIMGAATAEEAIERARAAVAAGAVMTDGAPCTLAYEIRETVLEPGPE